MPGAVMARLADETRVGNRSILFVDDAPELLLGLKLMFGERFEVQTAASAEDGLAAIRTHGAFSVVIADMRMPVMNGAAFLAKVRELSPDSTRMLLTGNADMATAIDAVNHENIFRYLTKPFEKEELSQAIDAGMEQYQKIVGEKSRLDREQLGNIKLLTDVLRAANPAISAKSTRIARSVRHISRRLNLPVAGRLEAAAELSQLGCVTLAPELVQQAYVGARLTEEEELLYHEHPHVAQSMLDSIPSMEAVGWMIGQQFVRDIPARSPFSSGTDSASMVFSARILKLAAAFDAYRMRTLTDKEALSRLRSRDDEFEKQLVDLLAEVTTEKGGMELRRVPVAQLEIGMVLEQEIRSRHGMLKMAKGQEVTAALRIKLYSLVHSGIVEGQVLVQVPV
jgi:ActR/RegA family two-component response regulator